jgi:hypothetical protein
MLGIWYLAWNLARALIPTAPEGSIPFGCEPNRLAIAVDGDFLLWHVICSPLTGVHKGRSRGQPFNLRFTQQIGEANPSPFGTPFT